jgi:hypothetical protein
MKNSWREPLKFCLLIGEPILSRTVPARAYSCTPAAVPAPATATERPNAAHPRPSSFLLRPRGMQ